MPDENHIVADGRERLKGTAEHRRKEEEVRRAVDERYHDAMAGAGLFRKIALWVRKRRELERELEKLAPRKGSYLSDEERP